MPFGCKLVTVAALALALTAPPTLAQTEEGVTVDPRSPAGKEYALPVEQARRDASDGGKGGRTSPGSTATPTPTPAFGEGVRPDPEPPARSKKPANSTMPGTSSRSASSAKTATPAQRAQEREDIDRALVTASADSGSSDGSLALLIGGVLVMVLGVAAGLALRRRVR